MMRRIAALSVAITLFLAPVASAQSSEAAPLASPKAALLNQTAFARQVQPLPPEMASARIVEPPRFDLLRRAVTAPTREAFTLKSSAPPRNWATRHKVITGIIIGVGAFFGALALCFAFCEE